MQDRIARKITSALALELTPAEVKTVADRGTNVMAAHDGFLKGWNKYLQSTPDDLLEAAGHFKEAIALDPNYGRAHAALALTYWRATERFWEIHLGMSWPWARILMLKHLEMALKEPSAIALGLASSVYVTQRRYDDAVTASRRAIALAPNSAEAHRALAYSLVMSGQLGEAKEIAANAWRFDPHSAGQHFFLLGLIAFSEGRLEQSVELFERARAHQKYGQSFLPPLIAAYMHIGRAKEGRALSATYYEYFSTHEADLRNIMYFWPFKDENVAARLADGLLLAGAQGKSGSYYNLSDDNRLTGSEIDELFGKTRSKWKVHDIRNFGDYPMDLTDSFRDGGVVIRRHVDYFGVPTIAYKKEWTGRYWINGDLLCMDFERVEVGGIGCRPVFRKATATEESVGPFVLVGVLGFNEISPSK
jgi:tetratricopeptide (TPR) repeat protein